MDIYPTIISWAGGVRFTDKPELDGINLEPLIDGEGFWPERRYFTGETGKPAQIMKEDGWFYRFSDLSFPLEERQTCLVDGEWSLVNDYNRWGLYNLLHDPKQSIDLKEIEHEKFSKMKDTYFNELEKIKEDPHAWSDPIQEVCENAYLELECVFRMKGRNAVTWANTFFNEVGAIQELKVKVLEKGNYHARLRALNIAEDTIVRLITANSSVETYLKPGEKYHDLGVLALGAGEQVFSLQLVDTGNTESLPKMEFFSLELMKNEEIFLILILTITTFKVVAEKPNIIIILADDLDADEINYTSEMHDVWATHSGASVRGLWSKDCNPRVLTPHIDSLAKNGMLFERYYVNGTVCSSSRYALLTGRYATNGEDLLRDYPVGTHATLEWRVDIAFRI